MSRKLILVLALFSASLGLSACDKASTPAQGAASSVAQSKPSLDDVVAQAHGFTVGAVMSAQTVWVFFDPQCPHCGHLWQASIPLHNQVKFVWIPIRLLNLTSVAQGAALLSSNSPAETMATHEGLLLAGKGGLQVPKEVSPELDKAIQANTELFNRFGAESVPFLVLRDPHNPAAVLQHEGALDTPELSSFIGLSAKS